MEIKKEWVNNAKADSDTYISKYKDSINNNDKFWNDEGKRIDWIKNYTKIKI